MCHLHIVIGFIFERNSKAISVECVSIDMVIVWGFRRDDVLDVKSRD